MPFNNMEPSCTPSRRATPPTPDPSELGNRNLDHLANGFGEAFGRRCSEEFQMTLGRLPGRIPHFERSGDGRVWSLFRILSLALKENLYL